MELPSERSARLRNVGSTFASGATLKRPGRCLRNKCNRSAAYGPVSRGAAFGTFAAFGSLLNTSRVAKSHECAVTRPSPTFALQNTKSSSLKKTEASSLTLPLGLPAVDCRLLQRIPLHSQGQASKRACPAGSPFFPWARSRSAADQSQQL